MAFNQEQAQKDYTELQRRISVGAYEERKSEHFETGTYPEDGVEESIDNLTELAARHGLEFIWDMGTKTWSLLPMSEETRAARWAAQEYQEDEEGDEDDTGDGSGLHQCPYCYNLVSEEHEEFCALSPYRNRNIVP